MANQILKSNPQIKIYKDKVKCGTKLRKKLRIGKTLELCGTALFLRLHRRGEKKQYLNKKT